jgi:hypothetical protein
LSPLKLLAEDAEDLGVISAALQDATAKIGDIQYEPAARRLTVAFNRFRWEAKKKERVRSALQFGGVLSVNARNQRQGAKDAVLDHLAKGIEPGEAPRGAIVLRIARDGDLRCEVECIDAALADLSDPWPARKVPDHS